MLRTLSYYLLSSLVFFSLSCQQQTPADLIVRNGTIYTVNEAQPQAEAVAVVDGKVAFVGSAAEAEKWIGDETQVLDLQGKTMTPGFIEGHAHFLGVGQNKMNLDLLAVRSFEEIAAQVAQAAEETPPGEWILGRGWHQDKWDSLPGEMIKGFPTHDMLSEAAPDNPVYLRHASGHAAIANQRAMEIAGVMNIKQEGAQIGEVAGGEVFRDELGNPTGVFNENAMGLVTQHIPDQTPESLKRAAELAMEECLAHGITSFHDAGINQNVVQLYKQLAEGGQLKVRLYAMLSGRDSTLLQEYFEKGPEIGLGNNFLTLRSIKLYTDGALGSRGAWLLAEYSDMPGQYGHETTPVPVIHDIALKGLQHGFQVCSHAIGDRANQEVLNQYEAAIEQLPEMAQNHRYRIEHAQHLNAADIPRFAELGVIPAMQAVHMASDRPWAIERLGKERIEEGAYVWRKLIDSGAIIVNGTDAPVEPIDPLASFYASVARKTLAGEPEGGYEPSQRMSREEALKTYTWNAAYGAFEEDIKGSIEVGKLADFTVFSQDIMQVPEAEILNTQVDYTIVDGEVAYTRD